MSNQFRDPSLEYWFYSGVVHIANTEKIVASFSGTVKSPRGWAPDDVLNAVVEEQRKQAYATGTANPAVHIKTFHQV